MAQKESRWKKPLMIAFLIMVVLGFSVPLFQLGGNVDQSAQQVQPRLCQSDADCYLTCENTPVTVLCLQNLCIQNACTEFNLFSYVQQQQEIALNVIINDAPLVLQNRNDQDQFVRFNDGLVKLYAQGLPLFAIMEKAGITLTQQCLTVQGTQYCTGVDSKLEIMVNGQNTYLFGQYVPKNGDEIRIVYS